MTEEPWLLALAAAICFGAALVLTQRGLAHVAPLQGAMISVPSSAVLLWLVAPMQLDPAGFEIWALAIFATIGLFFPAAVTLLTFEANRRMGPNIAGALGNLAPLFAVLSAILLLGEVPRPTQLAGLCIIFAGVVALSFDRRAMSSRWPLWAAALPIAAAIIRGLIQPATKLGLAHWPSPFAAVLVGYTVSAVVVAAAARIAHVKPLRAADRSGILWFALVGACNAAAVLLMYAALARGPVALVSPLVATYPLTTLALSRLLLGRIRLGPLVVCGVGATVAGVALLLAG